MHAGNTTMLHGNVALVLCAPDVFPDSPIRNLLRADPAVRRVIASWRQLTGGRPVRDDHRRTLVACSAGADSSALAIALAAASDHLVVAHIVHDLRAPEITRSEESRAAELAAQLSLPFVSLPVSVALMAGNAEQNARQLRYRALARVAAEHRCVFIATGHQADDQLETLLMRLIRGGNVRALAGIRERRMCHGITLVRPMLTIDRGDSERICAQFGWKFANDHTNQDTHRTRAMLRTSVTPLLRALRQDAAQQAVAIGASLAGAITVLEDLARELFALGRVVSGGIEFERSDLRAVRPAVVGELLVLVHQRQHDTSGRFRRGEIRAAVQAILGDYPGPRTVRVGHSTVDIAHASVTVRSSTQK